MSGKEIRTRVRQQSSKFWDLARYRGSSGPDFSPLPHAKNLGRFFWRPEEQTSRARAFQSQLPKDAQAVLQEADQICAHRFNLLGYEQLSFGDPIDWHFDPVHGKRAPLKPWFKIAFLKFSEAGDHKVIWEINRHQHLATLAKAHLLTGNSRYAQELVAQWRQWRSANRYPLGINWASSLEVAFRALSWIWVDHLLPASEFRGFRDELLGGLDFSGRYIERYLSTYFSPNTHLLGEAAALFFLGTLYPNLQRAAHWRTLGWALLTEQTKQQVQADGVYFEQSLYYHVYALDLFLHSRLLADLNGVDIPQEFDATLRRMLSVVQALAQAGPPEGFGDDDGGRLFNPRRNQTEHMTDPLALGSLMYGRNGFSAARLTEEAIWLFGETAAAHLTNSSEERRLRVSSQAFTESGLYIMVGSLPYPHQLVIDAGPQGTGHSGHGHADALSVRLTGAGHRWLVDSGSAVYIGPDQTLRDRFRGTAAHNTLVVDGSDQSVRVNAFSWSHIAKSRVERWVQAPTFGFLSASHEGYLRLREPVKHRRCIFGMEDGIYLIRDSVLGTGRHLLEVNWHFAPGTELSLRGRFATATRAGSLDSVTLQFAHDAVWTHDLLKGFHSAAYGRIEAAPLLKSQANLEAPAEIGSILTLSPCGAQEAEFSTYTEGMVRAYKYRVRDSTCLFFFPSGPGHWECGEWSSNAAFLYLQIIGRELADLVMIQGSALICNLEPILSLKDELEWFSWRKREGTVSAAASRTPAPSLVTDAPMTGELTRTRP